MIFHIRHQCKCRPRRSISADCIWKQRPASEAPVPGVLWKPLFGVSCIAASPDGDSVAPGPGFELPSPPPGQGDTPPPDVGPGDVPELPPACQLRPVYLVDPGSIDAHPLAELLPEPSPAEQEQLYTSIAVNGQQVEGVVLDSTLLDGRSRRGICGQLGLPLRVRDFIGGEVEALTSSMPMSADAT